MKIKYIIIFILFIILAGLVYFIINEKLYQYYIQLKPDTNTYISFEIKKDENIQDISQRLKKYNTIISSWAFIKYLKENNLDTQIKTGIFVIPPKSNIIDIANIFTNPDFNQSIKITIPEGYNIYQINTLLKNKNLITKDEFIQIAKNDIEKFNYPFLENANSLEGFLFPDTYFIDYSTYNTENFTNRLLSTFNTKIYKPYLEDRENIYDIIIMASMIEKEAHREEERPVISGILWSRLQQNWLLGVDATIRYYENDWHNPLTVTQLRDNNPYNTRVVRGLPPTPICNPGASSIRAALNPIETEYMFYLHGTDGKIRYAKTNEEHNINRIKYIK